MLNHLKKFFNVVEKEPEMADTPTQAPVLAVDNVAAELASVSAALASQTEAFSSVSKELAEMSAKYEVAKAALEAVEEAKEALVVSAAKAKLEARKQKVEAILGTEKSAAFLEATSALEDVAFSSIVSSLASSFKEEANSPLFTETGIEDSNVAAEAPTHFNKFIKK